MHTLTNSSRETKTSTTGADQLPGSVLRRLRQLIPQRPDITYHEALRIAELQASRLHTLLGSEDITEADIARLPRLRIVREPITTSGSSHWNGREWIICLNQSDSLTRQRFTLLHEFAHIVWNGHVHKVQRAKRGVTRDVFLEQAADYFAGCVLVPKRALKAAWGNGLQAPDLLAEHFSISIAAVTVRLAQTGLSRVIDRAPSPRCARPIRNTGHHPQQFVTVYPFNQQGRLHASA